MPSPGPRPRTIYGLSRKAISLGLRHASVHVEASRCAVSSSLRNAGFHRDAQCLDLSDPVSVNFTGDGSDADVYVGLGSIRSLATTAGYTSRNLQQVVFYYALFLAIDWISACFAFMLERRERWQPAVVVVSPAVLLPAGDVLRNDQICDDGDPWSRRWLGKLERKATAEAGP